MPSSDLLSVPRELAMGEVQYVWADPSSAQQQVALSAIVQAWTKPMCVLLLDGSQETAQIQEWACYHPAVSRMYKVYEVDPDTAPVPKGNVDISKQQGDSTPILGSVPSLVTHRAIAHTLALSMAWDNGRECDLLLGRRRICPDILDFTHGKFAAGTESR